MRAAGAVAAAGAAGAFVVVFAAHAEVAVQVGVVALTSVVSFIIIKLHFYGCFLSTDILLCKQHAKPQPII